MAEEKDGEYGIGQTGPTNRVEAPELPYQPRRPQQYNPTIGLIGCGGISEMHLKAYRAAGYRVEALCSRNRDRARQRQEEFFPQATIYLDYRELLERDDIEVVDITTHPEQRVPIIEAALDAGKHVLSQKPFVVDLDIGQALVERAARCQRLLAVNQNGRWAPHFSYMRQAISAGLVGEVMSADFSVHWDHNWIADTDFNQVQDLVLYDFAIHWFDMATAFMGQQIPRQVYAAATRGPDQRAQPPLLAQALVEYDGAQATFAFNGHTALGQEDRTFVVGTKGTLASVGVDLTQQEVTLYTEQGAARPALEGTWFQEGFHGAMAELLCAIETGERPLNDAGDNLASLALCFAAVASARSGRPVEPGSVRRLPD
ncbi:MAG: gfo/Idh/MocA family oxidoreductase [Candidatus Latescibacteria bacterium]|nr:gfo/Idh/MocA family oxidoreductase [Candidatus Latescibacterota bacterium]